MRIRLPFAAAFVLLCLVAAYAGLTPLQLGQYVNDKVLHTATFFILTTVFYWIIDTNRRRALNMTLLAVTLTLGVGSEFLQGVLPNGRNFDVYDIAANVVGSVAGLGLCYLYHKRMLERRRQRKTYHAVPGQDDGDLELGRGEEEEDEEEQETGVIDGVHQEQTLEEEVDNWDENEPDDWDDEEEDADDNTTTTNPALEAGSGKAGKENKKRAD